MAINRLIHYLHAEYAAPGDGVSDAELLCRCAGGKDEVAFELLMRRHADLVWRVCRVVTGDHHAAEDAFQAAFLALARKPPRAVNGPVTGWLYRVAYHAALKARPRRATTSDLVSDFPAPPDATDIGQKEIAGLLYEELDRLAEAYRVPLVMCYLEGYSHAKAARVLGWPVGTVATRVARGRDKLRRRLNRRGVAWSGLGLATALGGASTAPAALAAATARSIGAGKLTAAVQTLAAGAASAAVAPKGVAAGVVIALVAGMAVTLVTALGVQKSPEPVKGRPEAKVPVVGNDRPAKPPAAPAERGGWSKPLNGLQARLVLARDRAANGTAIVAVSVEFRTAPGAPAPLEIPYSRATWRWTVEDAAGEKVHLVYAPGTWLPGAPTRLTARNVPGPPVVVSGGGDRLSARSNGTALDLGPDGIRVLERGDRDEYFLAGRLFFAAGEPAWPGMHDLPRVRIPLTGN